MSTRRRKTINVANDIPSVQAVERLGIGDIVTLVSGDIQITTTVTKLERAAQAAK